MKPIPINGPALGELMERLNINSAELSRQSGVHESTISYILNYGRAARQPTREKLRRVLLRHGSKRDELDSILPNVPDEPYEKTIFHIEGDNIKNARQRFRIGAAFTDITMKDYFVAVAEESEPSHPLAVIRAAKAAAERTGLSLEDWVKTQQAD